LLGVQVSSRFQQRMVAVRDPGSAVSGWSPRPWKRLRRNVGSEKPKKTENWLEYSRVHCILIREFMSLRAAISVMVEYPFSVPKRACKGQT
jgi:hypothetical protein